MATFTVRKAKVGLCWPEKNKNKCQLFLIMNYKKVCQSIILTNLYPEKLTVGILSKNLKVMSISGRNLNFGMERLGMTCLCYRISSYRTSFGVFSFYNFLGHMRFFAWL